MQDLRVELLQKQQRLAKDFERLRSGITRDTLMAKIALRLSRGGSVFDVNIMDEITSVAVPGFFDISSLGDKSSLSTYEMIAEKTYERAVEELRGIKVRFERWDESVLHSDLWQPIEYVQTRLVSMAKAKNIEAPTLQELFENRDFGDLQTLFLAMVSNFVSAEDSKRGNQCILDLTHQRANLDSFVQAAAYLDLVQEKCNPFYRKPQAASWAAISRHA